MPQARVDSRVAAALLLALSACTQADPPASAPPVPAPSVETAAPAAAPEPQRPAACLLVTPEAMSKILGTPMQAEGTSGTSSSRCLYRVAGASGPQIEMTVEWGGAPAAMNLARMAAQATPQLTESFAYIGDEATMVGNTLMVRSGSDLILLVMADVADVPARARSIVDLARLQM